MKDGHKKWRVVEYKDGYGKSFFRVRATYTWLPFWYECEQAVGYDTYEPVEFEQEEEAHDWIKSTARHRNKCRRTRLRRKV